MKNKAHVNTRSKLARVGLCQQKEETVGVREQANPEKIYQSPGKSCRSGWYCS